MPKNIVVFSDGTGQDGAQRLDQRLSNIYKMYRASRIGPDSSIDPAAQIAFYDAGLGTDADSHGWTRIRRTIVKLGASIAGRGIATNIADCYEFIINHWQPGDCIFLFGFSRGAYTVRCVAQVLSLCGVPVHAPGDTKQPFRRFGRSTRKVAERAVRQIYEHGAGHPREKYEAERDELGRRFRVEFGSDGNGIPNAAPHFIGVFDTVAALGASGWKRRGIIVFFVGLAFAAIAAASFPIALITGEPFLLVFAIASAMSAVIVVGKLREDSLRWIDGFPETNSPRSEHHIKWQAANYDRGLSGHVGYARQAAAIDETRADFPRVPWGRQDVVRTRVGDEPEPMVQLFFSGNHSDVGGSYPEPESRLSDVALQWMIEEATSVPDPLIIDTTRIQVFPDPTGIEHSEPEDVRERKLWWVPKWAPAWLKIGWKEKPRTANGFPVHPSVYARFAAEQVDQFGNARAYRPYNLRNDIRFAAWFGKSDPAIKALAKSQSKATYELGDDKLFTFSIGDTGVGLSDFLRANAVAECAAVFPGAPTPTEDTAYLDVLALKMLIEMARKRDIPHHSINRIDGESLERGLLLLGLSERDAASLARKFGATTIVTAVVDGKTRVKVIA